MAWVRQFRDLMRQRVTIEPRTGTDAYGVATYGAGTTYRARVVGKVQMVRNTQGQEQVSTQTVYLLSDANVSPRDRITLPSGHEPNQPPIVSVGRFPDEAGESHTVLYLA